MVAVGMASLRYWYGTIVFNVGLAVLLVCAGWYPRIVRNIKDGIITIEQGLDRIHALWTFAAWVLTAWVSILFAFHYEFDPKQVANPLLCGIVIAATQLKLPATVFTHGVSVVVYAVFFVVRYWQEWPFLFLAPFLAIPVAFYLEAWERENFKLQQQHCSSNAWQWPSAKLQQPVATQGQPTKSTSSEVLAALVDGAVAAVVVFSGLTFTHNPVESSHYRDRWLLSQSPIHGHMNQDALNSSYIPKYYWDPRGGWDPTFLASFQTANLWFTIGSLSCTIATLGIAHVFLLLMDINPLENVKLKEHEHPPSSSSSSLSSLSPSQELLSVTATLLGQEQEHVVCQKPTAEHRVLHVVGKYGTEKWDCKRRRDEKNRG